MYWWSGSDTIYALMERGSDWASAHNTWCEGEALPPPDRPPGLHSRSAFYQTFPD